MENSAKWAAYDVARSRILIDICDLGNTLDQEQTKVNPDLAKIEVLEAEIDALDLRYDQLNPDTL